MLRWRRLIVPLAVGAAFVAGWFVRDRTGVTVVWPAAANISAGADVVMALAASFGIYGLIAWRQQRVWERGRDAAESAWEQLLNVERALTMCVESVDDAAKKTAGKDRTQPFGVWEDGKYFVEAAKRMHNRRENLIAEGMRLHEANSTIRATWGETVANLFAELEELLEAFCRDFAEHIRFTTAPGVPPPEQPVAHSGVPWLDYMTGREPGKAQAAAVLAKVIEAARLWAREAGAIGEPEAEIATELVEARNESRKLRTAPSQSPL